MLFKNTIFSIISAGLMASPVHAISDSFVPEKFEGERMELNESIFMPREYNFRMNLASMASWYGPGFYGNTTACGETFRPGTMTAAHRSLPCGTRVRVTNRNNGRSTVVRINDRGPFVDGRVLDLGEGAASVLGAKGSGVIPISMEVLN